MNQKLDPLIFFNGPNAIFWLLIAVIIVIQGWLVGRRWPEPRRWWTGWLTLFGGALLMVLFFGWNLTTWIWLALASALMRAIKIDRLLFDSLWQRRENQRWTIQYFAGFLLVLPAVVAGDADLLTWAEIFTTLGICGAAKVGWATGRESYLARKLRQKQITIPHEEKDGRTN